MNARKKAHLGMWMQAVTNPVELIRYGDSDKSGQLTKQVQGLDGFLQR